MQNSLRNNVNTQSASRPNHAGIKWTLIKFIMAFAIFIVFAIIYDIMKLWPNYLVNSVDIAGLYEFEKSIFGFKHIGNIIVTPNEYFIINNSNTLDFLCGLIYLNWIPVPLAYAVYLFFKKREKYLDYALAFLFVNLIGFTIYYVHPAAPPWYVELYGFQFINGIPGNPAALARFDELVGLPVFNMIYSQNSNVFAALPSLHCAYPVVMLWYGLKNNEKGLKSIISILMVLFMIGIWFSAVYTSHHYITDVILGVICAIVGLVIYDLVLLRGNLFLTFRMKYYILIK